MKAIRFFGGVRVGEERGRTKCIMINVKVNLRSGGDRRLCKTV